jgi:hypothetical protein
MGNKNLWLKGVKEELRDKKTGKNILVYGDRSICGQNEMICKAINDHTIHKARCAIALGDYLAYPDADMVLRPYKPENNNIPPIKWDQDIEAFEEAAELTQTADFFHIIRTAPQLPSVNWQTLLRADNCVFQYFGSLLRQQKELCVAALVQKGFKAIGAWDYSMIARHGLNTEFEMYYHIPMMFDSKIEPCDRLANKDDAPMICHAPTNREVKKTALFLEIMKRMDYPYDLIEAVPNDECLRRKSEAQICFDSANPDQGCYGLTAMESMAMGQVVLCGMNQFAYSFYPHGCPIIPVTEETLEERIKEVLAMPPDLLAELGAQGKKWVKEHHDPEIIVRQYCHIYSLIMNGSRNVTSATEDML